MDRRAFIVSTVLGSLAALNVRAQQVRPPARLGFLRIAAPPKAYLDALEQGLRERGYVLGRDVVVEYRFADGSEDQLQRFAAELVASKVDIILVAGSQATLAAKNATRTIPIVMVVAGDPVAFGIVGSLSRPGGNITGNTINVSGTLAGKRLELLKQVLPNVSRVAVLLNKDNAAHPVARTETLAAAATLAINVQPVEVQGPSGFDDAFAKMVRGQAEALVIVEDAMFANHLGRIVALAARNRLPTVYSQRNSVDAGGLMSYGPSILDVYRNASTFVDKILKGAKPADLPVEQPTKFELVINLNTANALGLTIPPSVRMRADEVIQ